MGDWVADVLRAAPPGSDFGLVNSGGLRADLPPGEVTFGDVYRVMPFDNRLVHLLVTGAEVRETLEQGITGHHGIVQVSGLRFRFDDDLPEGARIVGPVIDDATGAPLDPGRLYRIAVPDFLADGGDEFTTLAARPREATGPLVRALLAGDLKRRRPLVPPDPAAERRIVIE